MSKLKELFGNFLIKQSKDKGDIVVTQTITEREYVVNRCKAAKIDIIVQAISPDLAYIYLKPRAFK